MARPPTFGPGEVRASDFDARVVVLAPGTTRRFDAAEWRDALVLVTRGRIELIAADGRCWHFGPGAMLALERLPLRALRNPGQTDARLVVVTRRASTER